MCCPIPSPHSQLAALSGQHAKEKQHTSLRKLNIAIVLIGTGAILSVAGGWYFLAVGAGVLLCGWAEIDNACGRSHIGTISPFLKADPSRLWFKMLAAYTVAGLFSSTLVGVLLNLIGSALPHPSVGVLMGLTACLCLSLVLREARVLKFRLPQRYLQTEKIWSFQFGYVKGAAMWGTHIGFGFLTVISHGGIYPVAMLCALIDGAISILLLPLFWIGRVLPLWIVPFLLPDSSDGELIQIEVSRNTGMLRLVSVAGLIGIFSFLVPQVTKMW